MGLIILSSMSRGKIVQKVGGLQEEFKNGKSRVEELEFLQEFCILIKRPLKKIVAGASLTRVP